MVWLDYDKYVYKASYDINKSSSDLAEIYRDLTYGQTPTTHEISAQ